MGIARKRIGRIIMEQGFASSSQVKEAVTHHKENNIRIGESLTKLGYCTEKQVIQALGIQFGMPVVDLSKQHIPPEVLGAIPYNLVKEHQVIPVEVSANSVTVTLSDPLDLYALDNLRFSLGVDVECVLSDPDSIRDAIAKYYGMDSETMENMLDELGGDELTDGSVVDDVGDADVEDAPVIKLVTLIITEAMRARASDIHIEPMETRIRIRYRVDGTCHEVESPPKRLQGSIISRLKIMSLMDIAEKRKPQDGRIKIKALGKVVDLRVSALPANHGESVVMRILDKESMLLGIQQLGFHEDDFVRYNNIIKRPNGILLVTGPTGSGKTTTLYASLNELNRPDKKIITAENPVEYHLDGINQCQVRHDIGFDFSRILRSMLRQAPEIILVGEIRDGETANIAIEAALTGHLVFSTLHTNDAPSAITRLIDMGVKPFLAASSIQAVMAQRLVRTICKNCKEPYEPTPAALASVRLKAEDVRGITFYHGKGCRECNNIGFRGRIGIYELMEMDGTIREMAFKKAPTEKIRKQALQMGMTSLFVDGVRKVLDGITTIEEVLATAMMDEEF